MKTNYITTSTFIISAGLCGLYGFKDFFQPHWLDQILSWQTPDGCMAFEFVDQRYADMRIKRAEQVMDNGCLSHATGEAVNSLSLYVRYIIEDIYPNILQLSHV
jgi:hypothetical protein